MAELDVDIVAVERKIWSRPRASSPAPPPARSASCPGTSRWSAQLVDDAMVRVERRRDDLRIAVDGGSSDGGRGDGSSAKVGAFRVGDRRARGQGRCRVRTTRDDGCGAGPSAGARQLDYPARPTDERVRCSSLVRSSPPVDCWRFVALSYRLLEVAPGAAPPPSCATPGRRPRVAARSHRYRGGERGLSFVEPALVARPDLFRRGLEIGQTSPVATSSTSTGPPIVLGCAQRRPAQRLRHP